MFQSPSSLEGKGLSFFVRWSDVCDSALVSRRCAHVPQFSGAHSTLPTPTVVDVAVAPVTVHPVSSEEYVDVVAVDTVDPPLSVS